MAVTMMKVVSLWDVMSIGVQRKGRRGFVV